MNEKRLHKQENSLSGNTYQIKYHTIHEYLLHMNSYKFKMIAFGVSNTSQFLYFIINRKIIKLPEFTTVKRKDLFKPPLTFKLSCTLYLRYYNEPQVNCLFLKEERLIKTVSFYIFPFFFSRKKNLIIGFLNFSPPIVDFFKSDFPFQFEMDDTFLNKKKKTNFFTQLKIF